MNQLFLRLPAESRAFRWVNAIAFLAAVLWSLFDTNGIRYRLDTDVYRIGAQRLLDGLDLYSGSFHIKWEIFLPFTYPPIAALAFTPLTLFTAHGAGLVFGIVTTGVLLSICWIMLRKVAKLPAQSAGWFSLLFTALLLGFGPVISTTTYGQVNLVLLLLILLDFTVVPRKYRGILTGLATAFKLTPAVFGLWLLLRKDWWSIVRMGASTLFFTGLGFLVLPQASMDYWFGTLQKTDRIGGLEYASNQSINGELWRLGLRTADTGSLWWAILVVVVFVATVALMLRLFKRDLPVLALGVNALFGLLASPVSWDHHYVWIVVLLLALLACLLNPPAAGWAPAQWKTIAALMVAGILCFASSPRYLAPSGEHMEKDWNFFWHVLGNTYLWWSLAAFAALWYLTSARHDRARSVAV